MAARVMMVRVVRFPSLTNRHVRLLMILERREVHKISTLWRSCPLERGVAQ
ncbi:hypothetical protein BC936DRAFT_148797 [Jimgerdemannia flammicorona]|uniref:Uncharacterized protein n=1 Tax=Jimgerdemannia flammicorona TaxID=994334 RepID=A0A433D293_9FUNG|nr:hypothetical protein BC936DRAFT_148797 [Jimgerdemannia flammicorona]